MKAPTHCPVCGDPLLNIFPPAEDYSDQVTKSCDRKITHSLTFICNGNEVASLSVCLDRSDHLQAKWLFHSKELLVVSTINKVKHTTVLPFFEPNLSNYKKLIEKVGTYLVFS